MWLPLALAAAAFSLLVWLYGVLGVFRSLSAMREWPLCARKGRSVSVIIAARDEERRLPALLDSLLEAGPRLLEVIVVDDRSGDNTPQVVEEYARRDPRVRLVRSPGPPPGWAGKSYALHLGAKTARGGVLLFLDADTRPASGEALVAAAAELAEPRRIAAFVPRFLCRGWLCRAAEAYMTGVAHGFYGFHRVRSPRDSLAWMYGCCWAILRDDYWRLGGHEAVRSSIVEDRDFAAHAKAKGYTIEPIDAREWVGVESYETLAGYASLIARLSADKAAASSPLGWAAYVARTAVIHLAPSLLLPAGLAAGQPALAATAAAALAAQTLLYTLGAWVNLDSPIYGPLGHIALPAVLRGLAAAWKGATWRGRSYTRCPRDSN